MICPHCHATVLSSTHAATPAVGREARLLADRLRWLNNKHVISLVQAQEICGKLGEIIFFLDRLAAQPASPLRGRDLLIELADWCETARTNIGAIDGYDYRSGEEFGLRRAEIEINKRIKALSASPPEQAPTPNKGPKE